MPHRGHYDRPRRGYEDQDGEPGDRRGNRNLHSLHSGRLNFHRMNSLPFNAPELGEATGGSFFSTVGRPLYPAEWPARDSPSTRQERSQRSWNPIYHGTRKPKSVSSEPSEGDLGYTCVPARAVPGYRGSRYEAYKEAAERAGKQRSAYRDQVK